MDAGTLSKLLLGSMSPNPAEIKQSETQLLQTENQAAGPLLMELLKLVFSDAQQLPVRQAAAIFAKNLLKRRWVKSDDDALQYTPLEAGFKEQVRALLLEATCGTNAVALARQVQAQVNAIISFVAELDFPHQWPNLLPSLVQTLSASPSSELRLNALTVLCSVFRKYKTASRSTEVLLELKYVLPLFQAVHLQLFTSVLPGIAASPSSTPPEVFAAMEQILEIFYALNVIDIPEFYQDNISGWLGGFLRILSIPTIAARNDEDPTSGETIKTLACENLALYADKYQEPFEPFVKDSVRAVWGLLVSLDSNAARFDQLVAAGIRFLSSTANTRWSDSPFQEKAALAQICEKLVLPNIQLRDCDVELFSDNPDDFIRKDLQNADAETRRRSAVDLVKALCKFYDEDVTAIVLQFIQNLLGTGAVNARAKDACIQLVTAIAVKGETRAQGVTLVSPKVDVKQFFAAQVMAEIQNGNSAIGNEDKSVLLASCLKFLFLFRSQLERVVVDQAAAAAAALVIPKAAKVVQCYAAHAVCSVPSTVSSPQAVENALAIIAATAEQNEYLIKLVAKLAKLGIDGASIIPQLLIVVANFSSNPVNAVFTHYLFEALGYCVAGALRSGADKQKLRDLLTQPLCQLLDKNVMEYIPYALQVLALLIESSETVSEVFGQLFAMLLNEQLWRNPSLVPGIVRIVSAYLFRADLYTHAVSKEMKTLGLRFQLLLGTTKFEAAAFDLLNAVSTAKNLPPIGPEFLEPVFMGLLTKIHSKRTERLVRQFALAMACVLANPTATVEQVAAVFEKIQSGLSVQVIKDLWMSSVAGINAKTLPPKQRKVFFVAIAKLVSSPTVQKNPALLQAVLGAAEALIVVNPGKEMSAAAPIQEQATGDESGEFEVSYAKLSSTANALADADFVPQVDGDGVNILRTSLKTMPPQVLQSVQGLVQWTAM